MLIADRWPETCGDGCGDFFGRLLKTADPDVPSKSNVLEIGCAEFDWLKLAARFWPEMSFTGVDWREGETKTRSDAGHPHCIAMHGNVLEPDLFQPETFDLIVSVSAIEHMGLGHYSADPVDPDGDTKAMANAFRWLKPGGWLLFDVPYDPHNYEVCGTSHRVYNDDALFLRLWVEPLTQAKCTARWAYTVYAPSNDTKKLVDKPTKSDGPFYYVGMAWQKLVHPGGCRCLSCG